MKFTQATAALIIAFAAHASAHAAVKTFSGDVGGSMLGLGYNPNVPLTAQNKNDIESDANAMPSKKNQLADGLGSLNNKAKITPDMANKAIAGTPGPMPQVNKILTIEYDQMVIDGQFDAAKGAKVLIDPTATATFSTGAIEAKIVGSVPADVSMKKAVVKGTTVVGQTANIQVEMPAGLKCTGTVEGQTGVCLVRAVNNPGNGGGNLWGGHGYFQLTDGTGSGAATLSADAGAPADSATGAAKKTNTGAAKKAGNAARAAKYIKARFTGEEEEETDDSE